MTLLNPKIWVKRISGMAFLCILGVLIFPGDYVYARRIKSGVAQSERILSHRIIEVWDKIEYREGRIAAHVSFYGEEGVNIGESNFSLDQRGVVIYLCNGFQSLMTGQKLGEEIVARTFRLAGELSKLLGINSTWAFAYYFIGVNDERREDYSGVNFEETEGFRILDSLFKHFGFRYVDSKARGFIDATEGQLRELRNLTTGLIPHNCRGGGYQDMAALWEGIHLITAQVNTKPGVKTRGELLPRYEVFKLSKEGERVLEDSIVIAHLGLAQPAGPILDMITEDYYLRRNWSARLWSMELFKKQKEIFAPLPKT